MHPETERIINDAVRQLGARIRSEMAGTPGGEAFTAYRQYEDQMKVALKDLTPEDALTWARVTAMVAPEFAKAVAKALSTGGQKHG